MAGYGLVFITHKLPEVMICADRVAVMRRGRIVGTLPRPEASEAKLLGLMFGDSTPPVSHSPSAPASPGATALELDGITTVPEAGTVLLHDLSLTVRSGEVLGVAGVSGNGQHELAELILGLRRSSRGAKRLWGEEATRWSAARIRAQGVSSIPDDPLALALIPGLTVRENLVLGSGRRYRAGLGLDWRTLDADMERSRIRLHFPPLPPDARAAVLSGGNQQRLVLTRELAHGPRLIVALYPTRGLDRRGAEALHKLFDELRAAGVAVLFVSEDLGELFAVSDRLIVLRDGRIAGTFLPASFRAEAVGPCMVGAADAA
jgi:simple sugar transport system ATP-binding protein